MGMVEYIKAIKDLPGDYIDEKTKITGKDDFQWIIATNPDLRPILYYKGEWVDLQTNLKLEINKIKVT
jgi:hypothetical protein